MNIINDGLAYRTEKSLSEWNDYYAIVADIDQRANILILYTHTP